MISSGDSFRYRRDSLIASADSYLETFGAAQTSSLQSFELEQDGTSATRCAFSSNACLQEIAAAFDRVDIKT